MRKLFSLLLPLCLVSIFCFTASAEGYMEAPYNSYNYDEWENADSAPAGYIPVDSYYGDKEADALIADPTDMFIDGNGNFYITSVARQSVMIFTHDFKLINELKVFYDKNGEEKTLVSPNGIFYRDDTLYVCDSEQNCVFVSDTKGNLNFIIEKPTSDVYPQEKVFYPKKVAVDNLGYIYVISDGIYYGALCFDSSGNFYDFYGSNTVDVDAGVIMERFWRNFMTETQIDNTSNFVPVEYTNFDVDAEGFIYTCTATADTSQLKKLNSAGGNILPEKVYGDIKYNSVKGKAMKTFFADITVDDSGFIYGIDSTRGRVFVYDTDGSEMFIFGGNETQKGCFISPCAIDTYNENVYVLDAENDSVTEFKCSDYGKSVKVALQSYMKGNYTESVELWNHVLKMNGTNRLAYIGIGKALYYQGDYTGAIKYFKLGHDKELESRTFMVLRKVLIRKYAAAAISIIAIAVLTAITVKRTVKRRRNRKNV